MASKNRRSKARRKPPKRRKPTPSASQNPDRLARRVARVRPLAWDGERPEDVAVFDDAVLATLEPELAAEVGLVRDALQWVADCCGAEANDSLTPIARRSPMSQWRLLVRGLVDWYDDRCDEAQESWKRLDPERRPSRIARSLTASNRADLDTLISAANSDTLDEQAEQLGWDRSILSAARLVRQTRVERPAIVEAIRQTRRRERLPATVAEHCFLGPERLHWVIEFCNQYRQLEPQLVDAVQQAALDRAIKQPFADINQIATAKLTGPRHDPKNLLSQAYYHRKFEGGEERAESFMQQYLTHSLPNNQDISPQLKAAIQCEIYLEDARTEAEPADDGSLFSYWMAPPVDHKLVAKLYKKALAAYPAHAEAHREYVQWIREHAEDESKRKSEREPFEKWLLPAMKAWAKGVPEETEPRLWLVDHFLENEELEAAEPHVQWLSRSRHADPRVRATPWKWELLEAMRLCRRKAWLGDVSGRLDAAEKLWPVWLGKDWLPYLRAALLLRQGKTDEYQTAREEIQSQREADGRPLGGLTDAAMMLGAAQRMRVPAAELKPLRKPIDMAVKNPEELLDADLVRTASFFWDLHRTALFYPAYRMHGGKIAAELYRRLKSLRRGDFESVIDTLAMDDAVYWLASLRTFSDGYKVRIPGPLKPLLMDVTKAAVAIETLLVSPGYRHGRLRDHAAEIQLLRDTAITQQDPYDRYWFGALADRADLALVESKSHTFGFGSFNPFDWAASDDSERQYDWEDEDHDNDDESEFGSTAARRERAYAEANVPYDRSAYETDDNSSNTLFDRPNATEMDPNVEPPRSSTPRIDLPADPNFKKTRPKDPMGKRRKKGNRR